VGCWGGTFWDGTIAFMRYSGEEHKVGNGKDQDGLGKDECSKIKGKGIKKIKGSDCV